MKFPKVFIDLYNASRPIVRRVLGRRALGLLIRLDDFICKFISSYETMLFIILKDGRSYRQNPTHRLSPVQIMNVSVPLYYLQGERTIHRG